MSLGISSSTSAHWVLKWINRMIVTWKSKGFHYEALHNKALKYLRNICRFHNRTCIGFYFVYNYLFIYCTTLQNLYRYCIELNIDSITKSVLIVYHAIMKEIENYRSIIRCGFYQACSWIYSIYNRVKIVQWHALRIILVISGILKDTARCTQPWILC